MVCHDFDCSKQFNTYNSLKKHIESVHFITCNDCNESYNAMPKFRIRKNVYGKHICKYGNSRNGNFNNESQECVKSYD